MLVVILINHISGSAVSSYTSLLEKCQKKMAPALQINDLSGVFIAQKEEAWKMPSIKTKISPKYYNIPVCNGLLFAMGKNLQACYGKIHISSRDRRKDRIMEENNKKIFFSNRVYHPGYGKSYCVSFTTEYKKNKSTGGIFIGMK